jgi:hypothetical protein
VCITSAPRRAISANKAAARNPLVADRGPARCPACQEFLEFRTDRVGRTLEQCACGHRALAGDRVTLALSPYDLTRGRIVYRHK